MNVTSTTGDYEYTGSSGDSIYEITYSKKKVRINLSDNANWHLSMLKDIADKNSNEDKTNPSAWSESKEIREKFGIFFQGDSNARETLVNMLDSNLEVVHSKGIEQLSKIKEFESIKALFLDILDLLT